MWVVKLGGSLSGDALLPQWLSLLAHEGAGRVVVVCGGGRFADAVRVAQAASQAERPVHDLAAHNMAVLAMGQTAYMFQAWQPAFELAGDDEALRRALGAGRSVIWLPWQGLRQQADATTHWDYTSDSMALALAQRLQARSLVVVKSCAINPSLGIDELAQAQVLDRHFALLAREQGPAVHVLSRDQAPQMKALLEGD